MKKKIALLVILFSALASMAGYLILSATITAGKKQIAEGQQTIDNGQIALEKGITRLEAGKQELAEGKKEYKNAKDNKLLVIADKLFKGGSGFRDAETKIAKGDRQVAGGKDKIQAGERQLDAGELELSQGKERLILAEYGRNACAIGAAIFTSLLLVLGFRWRRSLFRTRRHTAA